MKKRICVIGGADDPNMTAILRAAEHLGVETYPLLLKENESPALTWNIGADELLINRKKIEATGVFMRRNVFHSGRPEAGLWATTWYETWNGWLTAHPEINVLNRACLEKYANKLSVLYLAAGMGLTIPPTLTTNDLRAIRSFRQAETVVKPVTGGAYCQRIEELLDDTEFRGEVAANPAIVQQQIKGDDIRIYRVLHSFVGFRIRTEAVDYRKTRDYSIEKLPDLPDITVAKLEKIMDRLGLDWGAADFKECANSGTWYFLEINSNPMFSAFDVAAEGCIAKGIIKYLTRN